MSDRRSDPWLGRAAAQAAAASVRTSHASGSSSSASVGSWRGSPTRGSGRRSRRARRPRRRSACRARTGAASARARAAARAAAAAGAVRAAALERRAQLGQVVEHVGADGVHDVLGVALDHAPSSPARGRAARAARARARRQRGRPRGPGRRGPCRSSRAGHAGERRVEVDVERAGSSRSRPARCVAQPRHAGELDRVGDLVQRDPAQELVAVGAERASPPGRGSARRTAAARGASASSSASSYWPSTRRPGSRRARRPRRRAPRRPRRRARPAARAPSARLRGSRLDHAADRGAGSRRSTPGGRPPRRPAARARRREPGVGDDERLGLVRRATSAWNGAGSPAGCEPRRRPRRPWRRGPVDHPPRMAGRPRRLLSARGTRASSRQPLGACARDHRGDARQTSSGAPSGSAHAVNATCPPPSRTISWPAATSTARVRHSVTIPSSRAGRDLAERDRDRADRAQRGGRRRRARRPRRAIQRGSADSIATISSLPPHAPLAAAPGSSGSPSSSAPPPRRATHSSPAPKSWTKPNTHVGHRRPVGDGDRERVVRQAALGVQRAVDRVDDHAHRPAAEVDARRAPRRPR